MFKGAHTRFPVFILLYQFRVRPVVVDKLFVVLPDFFEESKVPVISHLVQKREMPVGIRQELVFVLTVQVHQKNRQVLQQ